MKNTYKPEEMFSMTLTIFKIFGVWPLAVKHPTLRCCGYSVQLFYIVTLIPAKLINVYVTRNNLTTLMNNSFTTLTCISFTVKLGILFFRRKKIENLLQRLDHPIFAPRKKEHLIVLKKFTFMAKAYALIRLVLAQITSVSWIMIPLVDNEEENELPYEAWYPFEINSVYKIIYVFQSIFLLNIAIMNNTLNALIVNFYFSMSGQLETLKMEFKTLADVVIETNFCFRKQKSPTKKVKDNKKLVSSCPKENNFKLIPKDRFFKTGKGLPEIFQDRIIHCTERYEAILSFVKDITELFEFAIVVQVCTNCIIICVTYFKLTLMPTKTLRFYVILLYQICVLIEIFVFMWRGNEITIKASELKDAVYECAWISVPDKGFRKSLCIIMSRMQVAVKLRVGGFFQLSLDTFLKILSSAYSFYVLLKQVQAKKE